MQDGLCQIDGLVLCSQSTQCRRCAGRVRKKGEMNGKSNNMNNVLQQIYPTGCYIPPDELIGVFDADQVRCSPQASPTPAAP